jgi:electron transfer flavoprotein alpha subunit
MTRDILVVAEHRDGELRDITLEMLGLARSLAGEGGASVTVALLGHEVDLLAETLARFADRVEVLESPRLAQFSPDAYQSALAPLIEKRRPLAVLVGQTSYGQDFAPGLATSLGYPLISDVTKVTLIDGGVRAERPVYGGKVMARVRARGDSVVLTVQSGAFSAAPERTQPGEIGRGEASLGAVAEKRRWIEFVEAAATDVDVTRSDVVVSVGRGIGDSENIAVVEKLAQALSGVLACSRPVVDKKWLPKTRQIGISGKNVAPKLYLAVGISGAFQHVAGIKKAGTVVAINKDPNAPIFRVADYGVVADLFALVPKLTEKIESRRS